MLVFFLCDSLQLHTWVICVSMDSGPGWFGLSSVWNLLNNTILSEIT